MQRRTGLILAGIFIALGVFVAYAVLRTPDSRGLSDEDFLAQVRATGDTGPAPVGTGSLPPVGAEDQVAVLAVDSTQFDLGVVPSTAPTHRPLKVYNRGVVPLVIRDIRPSCACTQGILPEAQRTIAPGKSADIDVVFEPRRVPGFTSHKTLTIFANDPKNSPLVVDVLAKIEPEFAVEPEELDFGTVGKGNEVTQTLRVVQVREEPVVIESITQAGLGDDAAQVEDMGFALREVPQAERRDPAKNEYLVEVTLLPNMPPGDFTRFVQLNTNVERLPGKFLRVPARGTIATSYAVTPAFPNALMLRPNADGMVEGEIVVDAAEPLNIENLHFNMERLTVTPATGDPKRAVLRVAIAPGAPEGRFDEDVAFTVAVGGKQFEERVRVRGLVLPPGE